VGREDLKEAIGGTLRLTDKEAKNFYRVCCENVAETCETISARARGSKIDTGPSIDALSHHAQLHNGGRLNERAQQNGKHIDLIVANHLRISMDGS
jgi:hypothetical protein